MDHVQVGDHPLETSPGRDRLKQDGAIRIRQREVGQTLTSLGACHQAPTVKGVDEPFALGILITAQKMARHANAHHRQTQTTSHELIHTTQRDGDAATPIDDAVHVAVVGIEVLLGIAPESLFSEEHRIQGGNHSSPIRSGFHRGSRRLGPPIQLRLVGFDRGLGVAGLGQQPNGLFEVEVLPVAGAEFEKLPVGIDPCLGIPQLPNPGPDHRIAMESVGL